MPIIEGEGNSALVIVEDGDTSRQVIIVARAGNATFMACGHECIRVLYPHFTRGRRRYSRRRPDICTVLGFMDGFRVNMIRPLR